MKIKNFIRIFAGSLVLIGSVLAYFYSIYWLFLTGFIGLNLLQYGFTNWCLLAKILNHFGMKEE